MHCRFDISPFLASVFHHIHSDRLGSSPGSNFSKKLEVRLYIVIILDYCINSHSVDQYFQFSFQTSFVSCCAFLIIFVIIHDFFFFCWIIMVNSSKLPYLPAFPGVTSSYTLVLCNLIWSLHWIPSFANFTIQWGLSLKSVLSNLESWWFNLIVPDV